MYTYVWKELLHIGSRRRECAVAFHRSLSVRTRMQKSEKEKKEKEKKKKKKRKRKEKKRKEKENKKALTASSTKNTPS